MKFYLKLLREQMESIPLFGLADHGCEYFEFPPLYIHFEIGRRPVGKIGHFQNRLVRAKGTSIGGYLGLAGNALTVESDLVRVGFVSGVLNGAVKGCNLAGSVFQKVGFKSPLIITSDGNNSAVLAFCFGETITEGIPATNILVLETASRRSLEGMKSPAAILV